MDYDFLNSLKIKILELKRKRDEQTTEVMKDRITMSQIDEKLQALQREKQKIMFDAEEREMQIKKYTELIEQSEGALGKMVKNTQRLNEALNSALNDKI